MASVDIASMFTFPKADLPIIVTHKGQQIIGRVSSKSLCLASPVFEKFIHPPFGHLTPVRNQPPLTHMGREQCEDKTVGLEKIPETIFETIKQHEYVDYDIIENDRENRDITSAKPHREFKPALNAEGGIDFHEDNAESLQVLLQIIHFQFNKIPLKLEFEILLGIAHLCELYQCVHLVLPWLESWLEDAVKECADAGKEEYLFIAWSFGKAKLFKECANHLINEIHLVDGIPAINRGYVRYLDDIEGLPPKIIDSIMQARREKLERLLNIPYGTAQGILSSRPVYKCLANEKLCDSLIYGSLILALSDIELWPEKTPQTVDTSVKRLTTQLSCLDVHILPDSRYKTHRACKFDIRKEARKIYSEPVDCALDSHIRHIEAQERKLVRPTE